MAPGTWIQLASGTQTYTTTGNWDSGIVAGSSTTPNVDVATFSAAPSGLQTVTIDTNRYLGQVVINNAGSATTFATGTLRLDGSAGGGIRQASTASRTDTVSAPIVVLGSPANIAVEVTSTASLLVSGGITGVATAGNISAINFGRIGTGALTISSIIGNGASGGKLAVTVFDPIGAGVALSGASTYTGWFRLLAGRVLIGNAGALGGAANPLFLGDSGAPSTPVYVQSGSATAYTLTAVAQSFLYSDIVFGSAGTGALTFPSAFDLDGGTRTVTTASDVTLNGVISNGALTKAGTATLTLSGANLYAGSTTVNAGTLVANNALSLGDASAGGRALTVASGATLEIRAAVAYSNFSTSITGTGAGSLGALNFTTAAVSTNLGAITLAGATTIRSAITGSSLASSITNAGNLLTVSMPTVSTTFTLSGAISGAGGLTHIGAGVDRVLVLSNTGSSFSGPVTINGGRISYSSVANTGTNSSIGTGSGTSVIKLGGAANVLSEFGYTGGVGNQSTDRVIDLANATTTVTLSNNVSGTTLTFTSSLTATGAGSKTLILSATGGSTLVIAGDIVNNSPTNITSLSTNPAVNGNYTLTGTRTYTGTTTIGGGTGSVTIDSIANVGGGPSSFGAPATVANGTITAGSATATAILVYTGSGHSTDRVFNLSGTTGGLTLFANGTGALSLTSSFTATGTGAKTLTLSGTNAGANTISGAIPNAAGATVVSLSKTSVGSWTISGASTYTGAVNVSGGKATFAQLASFGSGTKTVTVTTTFRNASIILSGAGVTYPSTLSWALSSTGVDQSGRPFGAIRTTGASVIQGAISLTNNATFYADTADLTITGAVTGTGAFTFNVIAASGRTVTIAGGIGTVGVALTVFGPGTVVWNGSAANLNTAGGPNTGGAVLRQVMTASSGQFAHTNVGFGNTPSAAGSTTARYQYTGGTLELSNSGAAGAVNYTGLTSTSAVNVIRGSGTLRLLRDSAQTFTVTLPNNASPINGILTVEYAGSAGAGTIGTDSSIIFSGLTASTVSVGTIISDGTALVPVWLDANKVARPAVYDGSQATVLASQNGGATLTGANAGTNHNVTGNITAQVTASTNSVRLGTGTIALAAGGVLKTTLLMDAGTGTARTILAGASGAKLSRQYPGGSAIFRVWTQNSTGTGATISADMDARTNGTFTKAGSGILTFSGKVENLSTFNLADGKVRIDSAGTFDNPFSPLTLHTNIGGTGGIEFNQSGDVVTGPISGGGADSTVTLNGGDLVLRASGSVATAFGGDIVLGGSQKLKLKSLSANPEVSTSVQSFQGAFPFTAIELSRGYINIEPQYGATATGTPSITATGGGVVGIVAGNALEADYTVALGAITVSAGALRVVTNTTTQGNPYNTRVTATGLTVTGDSVAILLNQNANPQLTFTVAGQSAGPMGNGVNVWSVSSIAYYRLAGQILALGGVAAVDTVDFPRYGFDTNFSPTQGAGTSFISAGVNDNVNLTGAQSAQQNVTVKSLRTSANIVMLDATQQIKTDLVLATTALSIGAAVVGGVSTGKLSTQTGPLYVNNINATASINSDIVDNGATPTKLIVVSGNALTLNGNNTHTGGTLIQGGASLFVLGSATALGTGPVTANGGAGLTIPASTNFSLTNDIVIGDGGLTLTAPTTGFGYTIGTGVISGTGDLYLTSSGNYALNGASNTATGTVRMPTVGTVTLGAAQAFTGWDFNAGLLTFRYGTGVTQDISAGITKRPNNTYRIDTNGNDVTWASSVGNGSTYIKVGNGTHTLAAENFFATITIGNGNGGAAVGTVVAAATNALGYGTVLLQSGDPGSTGQGAALNLIGNITLPNAFTTSGTGISSLGLVRSVSGSNTLSGTITTAGGADLPSRFSADAGATLNFTGNIRAGTTGRFADFYGLGTTIVEGVIEDGSVTNTLAVQRVAGSGGGLTRLKSANTYTRGTSVGDGTILAENVTALGTGNVTLSNAAGSVQSATAGGQNGKLTIGGNFDNSAGGTIKIGF